MVMPKLGAQYMLKRLADEMMAAPEEPAAAVSQKERNAEPAAPPQMVETDEIDGTLIHDEAGEPIGRAQRVRSISVYMVSPGYGNLVNELEECLEDDECRRYFVHDDNGQLSGIIYAPHPDRMPKATEAIRADDI